MAWIFQEIDDAFGELPVFHLLAPGRTEVQGLEEKIALHLEVAPGHDVVERRHAPEERDVLKGTRDALRRRLVGAHAPAGHALEGDGAVLGDGRSR